MKKTVEEVREGGGTAGAEEPVIHTTIKVKRNIKDKDIANILGCTHRIFESSTLPKIIHESSL